MILIMNSKAVAFIDLYWLNCEFHQLNQILLEVQRSLSNLPSPSVLSRAYLYSEADPKPAGSENGVSPNWSTPLVIRVCGQDRLDDGYELVRAMDSDLRQILASNQVGTFVVASMDDRLALSLEQIKYRGNRVLGLQICKDGSSEDTDDSLRRMTNVFDQVLEPQLQRLTTSSASGVIIDKPVYQSTAASSGISQDNTAQSSRSIDVAVNSWLKESDEMTRDSAIEFMSVRRGLPKLVDARLLFLCRQELGRELSEPEKFELRRRFRKSVQERTTR